MRTAFRGTTVREGVIIRGEFGYGDFCPFPEYGDEHAAKWLTAALEACFEPWPTRERGVPGTDAAPPLTPQRRVVGVNCIIPAVKPAHAYERTLKSGCSTAKVKVAQAGQTLLDDVERVKAVRAALGPGGNIRVDANCAWSVGTAIESLAALDEAAGGLEYAEQPCRTVEELAAVRSQVAVPIAADESIRIADDLQRIKELGAADIAVIKPTPLGGIKRSLQVAAASGLPCVVSSALETSIGLSRAVMVAALLPGLDFACGLGTIDLFEDDITASPLLVQNGEMEVPENPLDPDPERLARFKQSSSERTEWWLERLQRANRLLEAPLD